MLAQALDRLANDLREVILRREIEGLSYKEIGTVVDVPIGTVISRLSRARKRLQRCSPSPARSAGMTHPDVEARVDAYLDGELVERDAAELEIHLADARAVSASAPTASPCARTGPVPGCRPGWPE